MKYFLMAMLMTSVGLAQTNQTDPLLDDSIREKPETEAYEEEQERQEEEAPRKPGSPNDPIGEFEEPYYDTGNGSMTNQNMNWPEP